MGLSQPRAALPLRLKPQTAATRSAMKSPLAEGKAVTCPEIIPKLLLLQSHTALEDGKELSDPESNLTPLCPRPSVPHPHGSGTRLFQFTNQPLTAPCSFLPCHLLGKSPAPQAAFPLCCTCSCFWADPHRDPAAQYCLCHASRKSLYIPNYLRNCFNSDILKAEAIIHLKLPHLCSSAYWAPGAAKLKCCWFPAGRKEEETFPEQSPAGGGTGLGEGH